MPLAADAFRDYLRRDTLRARLRQLPPLSGYLKMNTAKGINQARDNPGAPVWQRNYYERVIRDDRELDGIRQYNGENPLRWEEDENHPARQSSGP